jgi:hypothetical protein
MYGKPASPRDAGHLKLTSYRNRVRARSRQRPSRSTNRDDMRRRLAETSPNLGCRTASRGWLRGPPTTLTELLFFTVPGLSHEFPSLKWPSNSFVPTSCSLALALSPTPNGYCGAIPASKISLTTGQIAPTGSSNDRTPNASIRPFAALPGWYRVREECRTGRLGLTFGPMWRLQGRDERDAQTSGDFGCRYRRP